MKKIILFLCFVFSVSFSLEAQQNLQIIYITKDYTTEVNPLCRELRDIYDQAKTDPTQAVVFYLANSSSPIIVKVNLPGDNRKDFDLIMDALMTKSETIINQTTDVSGLIGVLNDIPLLDSNDQPVFAAAEIIYYITPTFWDLLYNEQIIATLYFALDMDASWADGYFTMSIYHCQNDGLKVDENAPFGPHNLCHNYKFFLLTYN